jgi:DNA-binding CsgD family transcriptional regulator/HEPN domain-containing protein
MRTSSSPNTPVTLVGRDRESAILREHLNAALTGQGSLVLIGGEAGIGKTALAEAFCREATEQGACVLVGRCYDLTETPPYGPWVELFGRYKPRDDWPALPAAFAERGTIGAVASQAALFHDTQRFLRELSARQPLVLLLDDLHWADTASFDLLRFLSRSAAETALLILVTYRSDELTRRHSLYQLLPTLEREARATRLDLRRLSPEAVRSLVVSRYPLAGTETDHLAAYLFERAEGNAFFILQLLRALEEEEVLRFADGGWCIGHLDRARLPMAVRQVIDGRLNRLDEESQRLLTFAAVIGQDVPFDLWTAVVKRDEGTLLETVEQATAAHLVDATSDGIGFRFVHALIREAVYEGILPLRRRVVHRQVGEALAALPDSDPDAVAYHFQQRGDARAAEWLVKAGERAQRAFAWLTAAERYEAAVALMPESEPEAAARGWLLYRISRVRRWERAERSIAYLDDALQVAERVGDRALAALVHFTRGIVRFAAKSEYALGVTDVIAGVEAIEALTVMERECIGLYEPAIAAYPSVGLVPIYVNVGRYRDLLGIMEGQPTASRAATSDNISATSTVGNGRLNFAVGCKMLGRPVEAQAEIEPAIMHFRATQNYQRLGQTLLEEQALVLTYETDNLVLRRRLAEECEGVFQRARAIGGGFTVLDGWLPELVVEGKWEEARALMDRIRHDEVRRVFLAWYGILTRAQGDAERAWQLVRDAVPSGPTTEPGHMLFVLVQASQQLAIALCLDNRDLPQARAWLDAHDRWLDWSGAVLGQSEGAALWAQYYRQAGYADHASQSAQRALAHATEPRQPLALIVARRLLGELATDAGRFVDADAHLRESLALADACLAVYERALTLLAMAELQIATSEQTAARALLDEVRAICTPLDAKPALARVDALTARLTADASPAPTYPDGLTEREVDVLRLLAGGKTNQEMANTLFLSPRTIERHITGLYRKIDARGRADATTYALRHRLLTID